MNILSDLSILCVEDDEFALSEMVNFLRKRAGRIYSASDGNEGISQYEIHKPDIVIADLLMPGMDGMTMIKHLKKINPDVHCIVVTSVKALDMVLESIDLGVDNYIVKPVEFSELEKKLTKTAEEISGERASLKGVLDCLEDRKSIEDTIKKEFIKALKTYTGRGPKEIIVTLAGREINIVVIESLTVMELNMMSSIKNHEVIRQGRNIAYEAVCGKFKDYLSELLGREVKFDKAAIDLKKKIDRLRFVV